MARTFIALKLALLRNSARAGDARARALRLAAVLGALAGAATAVRLATVHSGDAAVVVFGAAGLGWAIAPLIGLGGDETLSPAQLAILPLSRRQIGAGMLAASLLGVAPAVTVLVLVGAAAGALSSPAGLAAGALAALVALLIAVVSGRLVAALAAIPLRAADPRVSGWVALFLTVAFSAVLLLVLLPIDGRAAVHTGELARVARWTPAGAAISAPLELEAGHVGAGIGFAALALTGLALVTLGWTAVIGASPRTHSGRPATGRPGALLEGGRGHARPVVAAVAAKELRTILRDGRRRAALALASALALTLGVWALASEPFRSDPIVLVSVLLLVPGALATRNLFSPDGEAVWPLVAAAVPPRQELVGRNLAHGAVWCVPAAAGALLLALVTGGFAYLPAALALVAIVMLTSLGVGNVTSVYAAQPREYVVNPLARPAGSSTLALVVQAGAGLVQLTMLLPPLALLLAAGPRGPAALFAAAAIGLGWAALVWYGGLRLGARGLARRGPELLAALRRTGAVDPRGA